MATAATSDTASRPTDRPRSASATAYQPRAIAATNAGMPLLPAAHPSSSPAATRSAQRPSRSDRTPSTSAHTAAIRPTSSAV